MKDQKDKKVINASKVSSEKKAKALNDIDALFTKAIEKKIEKKIQEKEIKKQEKSQLSSSSTSVKKKSSSSSSSTKKSNSRKKFRVITDGYEGVRSEDEGDFVWDSDDGLLQPVDTDEADSEAEDLGDGRVYGLIENKYSKNKVINPEAPLERIDPESGLPVYKAHLLRVGKGGGTPLCPFDCSCCF